MFTGIIYSIGTVQSTCTTDHGCEIIVNLGEKLERVQVGDSVAVDGACLTISELHARCARFAVSPETLARCLIGDWRAGDRLNLEPAVTLQTPLGGHLIAGHIDDVGVLIKHTAAGTFTGMQFETTRTTGQLIAVKGSIAINGVSLTVNAVEDSGTHTRFEVMLVPHTLAETTLGALRPRAKVHLEADLIARYVQRLMALQTDTKTP